MVLRVRMSSGGFAKVAGKNGFGAPLVLGTINEGRMGECEGRIHR